MPWGDSAASVRSVAVAVLTVVACFSDPPPIDDGSTTSSSTTAMDASTGSPTDPADSGDATSVGATSVDSTDASGDVTGTSDTGTTGEPVRFCEDVVEGLIGVSPMHCLDFDDEPVVLDGWDIMQNDGDLLEFTSPSEGAPSPPNAMRSEIVDSVSSARVAEIYRSLFGLHYPLRVRFRLATESCTSGVVLAQILYSGAETYAVRLIYDDDAFGVEIEDSMGSVSRVPVPTPRPWAELDFRIDLASEYIDLWVDGEPALQMPAPMPPMANPDAPYVHLGLVGDLNTPCIAWYDDVIVY